MKGSGFGVGRGRGSGNGKGYGACRTGGAGQRPNHCGFEASRVLQMHWVSLELGMGSVAVSRCSRELAMGTVVEERYSQRLLISVS